MGMNTWSRRIHWEGILGIEVIYIYILVGSLEHFFNFPFHIWDVILPIDFHIFQDG